MKVADQADVFLVESESTPVKFEANRLKSLETTQTRGVGLRIVKDGRFGVASATDLDDPQFLVDAACEVANFGAQAAFEMPPPQPVPDVEVFDPAVNDVSIDAMVQLGQTMIDGVRAHNAEVLCEARVSRSHSRISILTSTGQQVSYQKSGFGLSVEGTLIHGTDMLFVGEGDSSCRPITDTSWIIEQTIEQLRRSERLATIKGGSYPVLMTPNGVAYSLVGPMATAFNGKTILQGASPLVDKLGEELVDSRFSVYDDPTIPFRPASSPTDDEGIPATRHALIDHGRITTFIYDLQTAGLAGTATTGNGGRSPGSLPSPALHGLVIDDGDTLETDMLSSIEEGLVVELLIGAGQGNVLGGDFGGNVVLGYKVEHGEIVGRVKDTMVSGNVWKSLGQIETIGRDGRWVSGGLYTPPLLLGGLTISSKDS